MPQLFQNKSLDIYIPNMVWDDGFSVKQGFLYLPCLCVCCVVWMKVSPVSFYLKMKQFQDHVEGKQLVDMLQSTELTRSSCCFALAAGEIAHV